MHVRLILKATSPCMQQSISLPSVERKEGVAESTDNSVAAQTPYVRFLLGLTSREALLALFLSPSAGTLVSSRLATMYTALPLLCSAA